MLTDWELGRHSQILRCPHLVAHPERRGDATGYDVEVDSNYAVAWVSNLSERIVEEVETVLLAARTAVDNLSQISAECPTALALERDELYHDPDAALRPVHPQTGTALASGGPVRRTDPRSG